MQNGKLELEQPVNYPDGTQARVTFFIDDSKRTNAMMWLQQYYAQTKDIFLDEKFEQNFIAASEMVNSWQLTK